MEIWVVGNSAASGTGQGRTDPDCGKMQQLPPICLQNYYLFIINNMKYVGDAFYMTLSKSYIFGLCYGTYRRFISQSSDTPVTLGVVQSRPIEDTAVFYFDIAPPTALIWSSGFATMVCSRAAA